MIIRSLFVELQQFQGKFLKFSSHFIHKRKSRGWPGFLELHFQFVLLHEFHQSVVVFVELV